MSRSLIAILNPLPKSEYCSMAFNLFLASEDKCCGGGVNKYANAFLLDLPTLPLN